MKKSKIGEIETTQLTNPDVLSTHKDQTPS